MKFRIFIDKAIVYDSNERIDYKSIRCFFEQYDFYGGMVSIDGQDYYFIRTPQKNEHNDFAVANHEADGIRNGFRM